MKPILHNCGRLEVRNSETEGYGVFATELIHSGEVLEEVPFVLFPNYTQLGRDQFDSLKAKNIIHPRELYIENLRENLGFKTPEKYYFKWSPPNPNVPEGNPVDFKVLPLGFGPIYNTSNSSNNAGWKVSDKLFTFIAEKDIRADEEIKTFYGYFLGEDGSTWNVDQVFFLGMDYFNGKVLAKCIRYADQTHVETVRNSNGYQQILSDFTNSVDGLLKIKSVETGPHVFNFPEGYSLNFYYRKLAEFKSAKFDTTTVSVEYVDRQTSLTVDKKITLPNR